MDYNSPHRDGVTMEIIRRKTEYGIRALVHLALHPGKEVTAAEIVMSRMFLLNTCKDSAEADSWRFCGCTQRSLRWLYLAKNPKRSICLRLLRLMQGKLAMNKCFWEKTDATVLPSVCSNITGFSWNREFQVFKSDHPVGFSEQVREGLRPVEVV